MKHSLNLHKKHGARRHAILDLRSSPSKTISGYIKEVIKLADFVPMDVHTLWDIKLGSGMTYYRKIPPNFIKVQKYCRQHESIHMVEEWEEPKEE